MATGNSRRRWALLAVLGAVAVVGVGAVLRRIPARSPRLVLVYATCTLNRNYLSLYNPAVTYTPALDELSRRATVFNRHFAESGRSSIDYATLFTGQDAVGHGVFFNGAQLTDDVYTMGEAFRDGGYDTYFWNGHPFATARANYGQGFDPDHIIDGNTRFGLGPYGKRGFLRGDDPTFTTILDDLQAYPRYRAFLLTNFSVTHGPYEDDALKAFCSLYPAECTKLPPDYAKYRDLFAKNFVGFVRSFGLTADKLKLSAGERALMIELADVTYRANVWRLDRLFGGVVEEIRKRGLLDDTLVVFTTDHGELLYKEGVPWVWTHGFDLTPDVLNIPLLLAGPKIPAGRYDGVTRSVDVFPTIAALAGVPLPPKADGQDLSATLTAGAPARELLAYSHTALSQRADPEVLQVAVHSSDQTYLLFADRGEFKPAMYDPSAPPYGPKNLYDASDPAQAKMFATLDAYKQRLVVGFLQQAKTSRPLSDEEKERLRVLGYGDGQP